MSFNTSNLGGDPYINCFISGAVELVALAYIGYTFPRFGRRRPYFVALMASGVILLSTAAIPKGEFTLTLLFNLDSYKIFCLQFFVYIRHLNDVFCHSFKLNVTACSEYPNLNVINLNGCKIMR